MFDGYQFCRIDPGCLKEDNQNIIEEKVDELWKGYMFTSSEQSKQTPSLCYLSNIVYTGFTDRQFVFNVD